jgi:predicted transcriptional regulator
MTESILNDEDLEKTLKPVFDITSQDAYYVYLTILAEGPSVTQTEIKRILRERIAISRTGVFNALQELLDKGFLLERRIEGKKRPQYILINPKTLFNASYEIERINSPYYIASREKVKIATMELQNKLYNLWESNQIGLGLGRGVQKETYDFSFSHRGIGPANVCGWLDTFREELKGKELWFFTPHLTLLRRSDIFRELMRRSLEGLDCIIHFFVLPGMGEYEWTNLASVEKDLVKGPVFHWYKASPGMFPEYLRVNILGNIIGVILLRVGDQYRGQLFYRDDKKIEELTRSIKEMSKFAKEKRIFNTETGTVEN